MGDTQPMAPATLGLVVPPFDQESPALGRVDPGLLAAAPARRAGRGPRSQRGASMGATLEIRTPSLQWRRGDRQRGAARPYRQPRASWRAGPVIPRPGARSSGATAPTWGARLRPSS